MKVPLKCKVNLLLCLINPLTLELNPSKQCSLLRFFAWDIKFYCLLLEKTYLIDFSFKFNANKILHSAYELVKPGKNVCLFL